MGGLQGGAGNGLAIGQRQFAYHLASRSPSRRRHRRRLTQQQGWHTGLCRRCQRLDRASQGGNQIACLILPKPETRITGWRASRGSAGR
jgi:hypothetical protein